MNENEIENGKCLIEPLGVFGEHWKGYSGCGWCKLKEKCMKASPWKGKSIIFKGEDKVPDPNKVRPKLVRPAKVRPKIVRQKLKGFFTPN